MNIKHKIRIMAGLILVFSGVSVQAQSINLTLRDALNYALQNNANIQKSAA